MLTKELKEEIKKKIKQTAWIMSKCLKTSYQQANKKLLSEICESMMLNSIDRLSKKDEKKAWEMACRINKYWKEEYEILKQEQNLLYGKN